MPTTYEPIATQTLGIATQSITFTSITGTYTDLRVIIANAFTSNTAAINMRFNGDTGTNYSYTQLSGGGASAYSNRSTSLSYARILGLDNGTSTTIPHMSTVDIFSYAGSTFKTLLALSASDKNGSGAVETVVNLWRSSSAITSVEVRSQSGTLAVGTTATLYGIKNA
jgi:hypothetical protein